MCSYWTEFSMMQGSDKILVRYFSFFLSVENLVDSSVLWAGTDQIEKLITLLSWESSDTSIHIPKKRHISLDNMNKAHLSADNHKFTRIQESIKRCRRKKIEYGNIGYIRERFSEYQYLDIIRERDPIDRLSNTRIGKQSNMFWPGKSRISSSRSCWNESCSRYYWRGNKLDYLPILGRLYMKSLIVTEPQRIQRKVVNSEYECTRGEEIQIGYIGMEYRDGECRVSSYSKI